LQGVIPLALGIALLVLGWMLFAERFIRDTIVEAGTKALGTQLDIASLEIDELKTGIELRGIAVADPFDSTRNLFETALVRLELEPEPLFEKKLVVRRLTIGDVRTGTRRAVPAKRVAAGGFAPSAMKEIQQWAKQFQVPLLSLTPIDTIKAIVLDPTQLATVQAALGVAKSADSIRTSLTAGYENLKLQQTLDTARALVTRLQGTNVRTLGVQGVRTAIADIKRVSATVDSAKRRVESLAALAKSGVDSLQGGLRAVDEARKGDYAFARGLLKLPSIDAPDIGAALFGKVTIDRFQQALYWTTLARKYAPAGLLPREDPGPKRVRMAGSTLHFVKPEAYPRFLLRRADVSVSVSEGPARGAYSMALSDVTTDPALVGRPMLLALRRAASGTGIDSLRVLGSLDHTGARPRESFTVQAAGVKLPSMSVPVLPFRADPGRGTSELRFSLDGDRLTGHWSVASGELAWPTDSARQRSLNTVESLVARVLTGVRQLDLSADVGGTLRAPTLAVRSNLDRVVADRLRAVVGEEVTKAEAKVRAQVDKIVEEKSAPVKARVAEVRAESEKKIAEARARLDEEKKKLDAQLKTLSGGLVGLPKIPGVSE
jgi:uncharacterized protein (TIGR03545 family)